MEESDSAYVREALPSEYKAIGRMQARAFINDPAFNWFGQVSQPIQLPQSPKDKFPKALELLYFFTHSLTVAHRIAKGHVLVVVVPCSEGNGEKIVAVALWKPPGCKIDSPLLIVRSGQLRTIFGTWKRPGGMGFTGVKRTVFKYQSLIDKLQDKACKAKSLDHNACWYVQVVATDPDEQRKGYCRLLMTTGFEKLGNVPFLLDSTTAQSRDVYSRLGFEVTADPIFGKGEVSADGIRAKSKEDATGFQVWTMMRLPKAV